MSVFLALLVASAAAPFVPVPAVAGQPRAPLALRVVKYDGSTNGEIQVEVRNGGKAPARFAAQGLYFVPQVDARTAPQRLGAVGSLTLDDGARIDDVLIPAGATVAVKLDVFCIDSHRASPTSATPFQLARTRLPQSLSTSIETDAKAAVAASGAPPARAKSVIQGEVWKNRDADWVRLEGEGAQEVGK